MPKPDFVVHHPDDSVGVVVVETIAAGRRLSGWTLETGAVLEVHAVDPVPLGHKLALRDIAAGETVVKYGQDIGRSVAPIPRGSHVHVHNLKTKRW